MLKCKNVHQPAQVAFISMAPKNTVRFCHACHAINHAAILKIKSHYTHIAQKHSQNLFWSTICRMTIVAERHCVFRCHSFQWTLWYGTWHFKSVLWNCGGKLQRFCPRRKTPLCEQSIKGGKFFFLILSTGNDKWLSPKDTSKKLKACCKCEGFAGLYYSFVFCQHS